MGLFSDIPISNNTELSCAEYVNNQNRTSFVYQNNVYGGIPETLTINAIAWVVSSFSFDSATTSTAMHLKLRPLRAVEKCLLKHLCLSSGFWGSECWIKVGLGWIILPCILRNAWIPYPTFVGLLFCWFLQILLLLFAVLRRLAWDYGRIALVSRREEKYVMWQYVNVLL